MDEKTIEFLEKHIPELAEAATQKAFWQTLASGRSVLIADNGTVKEMFPDGTSQIVDENEPPIKMRKGQIIKIKKLKIKEKFL